MTHPPYFSGFDPLPAEVEPRLMPDAKPFTLNLDTERDTIVICIHGFTGSPYEVAPGARAIADRGVPVVAPLLPGHGYGDRPDQEREFARIRKPGMLAAARQEVTRARERYRQVGIVGFSMGGAIALCLAAEGLVDACAVVAPALRLPPRAEILIPLLSWASFNVPAPGKEPFYLPTYDFHHSWALRTLWQLRRLACQRLPQIQCPVLGIHSHNDPVVPPVVLGVMEQRITAPLETKWFDNSGHSMFLDQSGAQVSATVADFIFRQFVR
jgi:carboxylesterase